MKLKLLPKFILSLSVLGVALTIAISFFSYQTSKSYLQDMYASMVLNGSRSIADTLDVEDVKAILAEDGDQSEAYAKVVELLETLKKDGEITYLSLTVPDEDSVTFYIDICIPEMGDDPADQIPYGSDILYEDAAEDEDDLENYKIAWDYYSRGEDLTEPLVTDNDYGYNYTAVAPIYDENGNAIAEIQYILDMAQVREHLNSFLYTMLIIALGIVLIAILSYMLFVRRVVINPICKLAAFTKEITDSGQFEDQQVDIHTGDEIEDLGSSFNFMLKELENYISNLSKVTAEKERIGAELDIAAHIQASMLPCIFPAFPDRREFEIYASMNPAKEVGGDFYDFFMVDETHLAIVMADVSGKGVPAALFMVIGKTLIKDHTLPGRDLGEVFTRVNDLLCETNGEGLFITAFEGVLDLVSGEFAFVNAGHEPPFICRKGERYEPYKIRPGFILAGMEEIQYMAGSITLAEGDKIFQYTDGVTEATSAEEKLYGMGRLETVLNRCVDLSPTELLPEVKKDIDRFVGDAPQFDDITMLCLEFREKSKREGAGT
ncbi:MAG: PP2C family protein-serine/threonine phosphatase [Clostridiales bacterium]|nr:PP2C family protein-serine/threonine phosphatase [Clostridiales bacterium]